MKFPRLVAVSLVVVFLFGAYVAHAAWSEPACGPTDCNTDVPLNAGSALQLKNGSLGFPADQSFRFGNSVAGKQQFAGWIRYMIPGNPVDGRHNLTIIGGGSTVGDRLVKVYDNLDVYGNIRICTGTNNCNSVTGGGGDSRWVLVGNNIYNSNTGNVGVGTNNPLFKLQVKAGTNQNFGIRSDNGELQILASNDTGSQAVPLNIYGSKVNFVGGGNVGVGTNNPADFKLQVAGNVGPNADNQFNLGSPTKRWANLYASNIYTCSGPGSCSPITGGGGIDSNWGTSTSAAGVNIYNKNNGNVGVGVTMPPSKFSVRGGPTSLDGGLAVFGSTYLAGNTEITGNAKINGNTSIRNTNYLDIGADFSGRAWSTGPGVSYPVAGVFRYTGSAPSPLGPRQALDILGGGVSEGNRLVRLIDNVYIPGNICNGNGTVCSTIDNLINRTITGGGANHWATTTAGHVYSQYLDKNVGIGTNNPAAKLHVKTSANRNFKVANGTATGAVMLFATDDSNANSPLQLNSSSLSLTGGNVGVGTIQPNSFKLEVAGHAGPSTDNTYDLGSAAKKWRNLFTTKVTTNEICTVNGICTQVNNLNGQWELNSNGTIYNKNPGNVGIGSTNPQAKLHVSQSGTSQLMIEGTGPDGVADLRLKSNTKRGWSIYQDRSMGDLMFWQSTSEGGGSGTGAGLAMQLQTSTGRLIVNKGITLPMGAGVGKILTSDGAGNATWRAPQVETVFASDRNDSTESRTLQATAICQEGWVAVGGGSSITGAGVQVDPKFNVGYSAGLAGVGVVTPVSITIASGGQIEISDPSVRSTPDRLDMRKWNCSAPHRNKSILDCYARCVKF